MTSHEFTRLLVELAVLLVCALLGGWLMRRLRQPAVLGEMLAGIVLGPTILGSLAPEWQDWLFSDSGAAASVRGAVIKLGMLFFLFVVGLEIDLGQFRKFGWAALLIGAIGTLVPLACGVAMIYALPDDMLPPGIAKLPFGLFIGTSLANTANPVLARILVDLGLFRQELGAMLMTATIVDDLVSWSLVAVILETFDSPGEMPHYGGVASSLALVGVLLVAALLIGRFVATPLLRVAKRGAWPTSFISATIVLVLFSAAVSEHLGIHAFLGPFLLGIGIASTPRERREAHEVLNQFALSFFVPIYFVSMGLTADFIGDFDLRWVAAILVVACLSKITSAFAAARLAGLDNRTSLVVGMAMNARGATGIILAGVGLENGVVDRPIYVALVVMALATSLAAGPLIKWLLPWETVNRPATIRGSLGDPDGDASSLSL
jgi:Kef-type K+ transport system membrane component KefB